MAKYCFYVFYALTFDMSETREDHKILIWVFFSHFCYDYKRGGEFFIILLNSTWLGNLLTIRIEAIKVIKCDLNGFMQFVCWHKVYFGYDDVEGGDVGGCVRSAK